MVLCPVLLWLNYGKPFEQIGCESNGPECSISFRVAAVMLSAADLHRGVPRTFTVGAGGGTVARNSNIFSPKGGSVWLSELQQCFIWITVLQISNILKLLTVNFCTFPCWILPAVSCTKLCTSVKATYPGRCCQLWAIVCHIAQSSRWHNLYIKEKKKFRSQSHHHFSTKESTHSYGSLKRFISTLCGWCFSVPCLLDLAKTNAD